MQWVVDYICDIFWILVVLSCVAVSQGVEDEHTKDSSVANSSLCLAWQL